MRRKLTADPLPVRFNSGSSITKLENADQSLKARPAGGRIHPGYIDDQACVCTRYLLPDTHGCPRFRFSRRNENEPKSQKHEQENPLIDSYYPTVDCDCSEEQESQKTYSEFLKIKKSENRKSFNNTIVRNLKWSPKPPFDCRTFTIYSCRSNSTTVPEVDNPPPEGHVDLEKSCETSSSFECFSELHKRIANLEEKLQHTLEKSIEINERKRQKSGSVQKLFRIVSGVLERNGKQKVNKIPDSDKSDTEEELRNIKKRLHDLETKLKRENNCTGRNHESSTSSSLLLKESGGSKACGISNVISKENDYTKPLHTNSGLYPPKKCQLKNKKNVADDEKTKQKKATFLSKCKRKRNSSKKIPKPSNENQGAKKECENKEEVVFLKVNDLKVHEDPGPEWKRKFKKRRRIRSRNLCKKNSKTNILKEDNVNVNENVTKEGWMKSSLNKNKKCWQPCACRQCPFRALSSSLTFTPEIINNVIRPCCDGSKTGKGENLDFFKPLQSIKMPILFEEVTTKPKFFGPNGKTSNVSMRLILTQGTKNPLVTLRKLVKKLSQTHSFEAKDQ